MTNKKQTLLIVDDQATNIKVLREILKLDYTILVAKSGEKALELVEAAEELPDLILLDIIMSGIDGYEVCKQLKHSERSHHISVIFITSQSSENDEIRGFEVGAVDYITKPFSAPIVKARIKTHLEIKELREHFVKISEKTFLENEELATSLLESNYNLEKYSSQAIRNEIAFLQAQIKPHFLFNTLSSIISLGKANSPKSLELLINLSNYLKKSFQANFSAEYIHLKSELEIISSYIKIEEARFGDRFTFNIEVDSSVLNQKIIPLLIQPLVENAIRHGALKTSQEQGIVSLSIEVEGEFIRVLVTDNGPGFDQKLKEMLLVSTSNENETMQGIGIMNINSRLKHYYQEKLYIENNQSGVKVWFRVGL